MLERQKLLKDMEKMYLQMDEDLSRESVHTERENHKNLIEEINL